MSRVIQVEGLSYLIQNNLILDDVSMYVEKGEFVGVIGPNGSGKSTLLKNIYRVYSPSSGSIQISGREHFGLSHKETANELAVVSQESNLNFDFSVEEVVSMGRYPKKKMLDTLGNADYEIVYKAICQVEMENFAKRSFLSLSGGEKQRVLIARALAQQTDIIILDEPTNHLDIGSKIGTLQLLKDSGKTILTVLHDMETAANYCDRIYILQKGRVLCSGAPRVVITPQVIDTLYGVRAEVFEHNNRLFFDYC